MRPFGLLHDIVVQHWKQTVISTSVSTQLMVVFQMLWHACMVQLRRSGLGSHQEFRSICHGHCCLHCGGSRTPAYVRWRSR